MNMKIKLIFLLFFSLSISLAFAQDPKQNPRYKSAKDEATIAFQKGKYEEAAEAYQKAFSIVPVASLLFNIALSYEQAGKIKEAVDYYQRFCDQAPQSKNFAQAQAKITQLANQLMKQAEDVTIQSNPEGAVIYVNSKAGGTIGTTPLTTKMLAGEYMIIAEKEGFVSTKQKLTVQTGSSAQLSFTLYDMRSVVPVRFLIDHVGAKVYVDNRLEGESPLTQPLLLKKGVREIKIVKPTFQNWVQQVEVQANQGEEQIVNVNLLKEGVTQLSKSGKSTLRKSAPWILMAVGLVSAGVGSFFGLSAQNLYDQLGDRASQGQLISPTDIDAGNRFVLFTNLLIGFGAVSTVSGAVWLIVDRESADIPNATVNATPKAILPGQQPVPMFFKLDGAF
jgi:tetratricopeptide (TPR) repeat protein